jgi:hypothetical protein
MTYSKLFFLTRVVGTANITKFARAKTLESCEIAFVKKGILLLAILVFGIGSFAQSLEESFSTISAVKPVYPLNGENDEIVKYENNLITFAHKLETGLNREKALSLHLFLNSQAKYESAIREAKDYVYPLYGVGQKYFIDATSSYVVNNYYTSILGKNHGGGDSLIRNTGYEYPLTSLNDVYRYATNKFQKYDGANCKLHITTSGLIASYGLWKPTYSFTESRHQLDYFEDFSIRFNNVDGKKNNLIPHSIESVIIIDEAQTPSNFEKGKLPARGRIDTFNEQLKEAYIPVPYHFLPEDTDFTMMKQVFTDETSKLNLTTSKIPQRNKSPQDFTSARVYCYTMSEKKIIKKQLNADHIWTTIRSGDKIAYHVNIETEHQIPLDVFNTKKMFSRYNDIYDSSGGNKNFDTLVNFLFMDNYEYIDSKAIFNKYSCIVYDLKTGERYNLSIPRKKTSKSYQLDYTGVSDGSELPKNLQIKFGTPPSYYQFGTFPKSRLEYNCDSNGCEYSRRYRLSLAPLYVYAVLRNN